MEQCFAAITDLVTTARLYMTSITCIYTSITFSVICSITWGFLKSAYFSMRSMNISLLVLSLVQFNKFSTRFSWSSKILSGKTKLKLFKNQWGEHLRPFTVSELFHFSSNTFWLWTKDRFSTNHEVNRPTRGEVTCIQITITVLLSSHTNDLLDYFMKGKSPEDI